MQRRALFISGALLLATFVATGFVWNSSRTVAADGEVAINETNFPDKTFRKKVSDSYDLDSDGYLSQEEMESVTRISIQSKDITSLKGIEHFTLLKSLYFNNTQVKTVDLRKNTKLTTLNCRDNQLKSLNVSKNTKLTDLNCSGNPIGSLDLSKNTDLYMLTAVDCNLKSLKFGKNTRLYYVSCNENELTSIDVTSLSNMQIFACDKNNLSKLDVSQNKKLISLGCTYNSITGLNLEENTALYRLDCYANSIRKLDVSRCPYLVRAVEKGKKTTETRDDGLTYVRYTHEGGDKTAMLMVDVRTKASTTVPPEVPANISAVAISATSVKVTWDAVKDSTGYSLLKSTSPDAKMWEDLGDRTTLGRTVTDLSAGTTYYFVVRAYKVADGERIYGKLSEPVKVTVVTPPPQNVKANAESSSSVKVSWKKVTDAAGYQVWRAESEKGPFTAVGSVTDTCRVCTGLKAGTQYYFKVRSYTEVNGKKTFGDYSDVAKAYTQPKVPTNVKATVVSDTKINVSWSKAEGAGGYEVYRSTSKNGTYSKLGAVTTTDRDCPGLTTGTTYYFKVRAYLEDNGKKVYSDYSAIVSAVPKLSAPTGVKATVLTATKVQVSWNEVTNATGYEVYRSTSKDGTYSKLGEVTTTSRDCPGLTTGTTYYFKVRAYKNVDGTKVYSDYSAVVSAVPKV